MKNKMKRFLAFVVAFAMVFTLMPGNSLVSRAADGQIAEGDYSQNVDGIYEATIPSESEFDSVEVPDGYVFTVDGACTGCTIGTLIFKGSGSKVNIFGKLTVTTVEPVVGARIMVGGENWSVSGITLLNEDGSQYPTDSGDWVEFEYREENSTQGWYKVNNANNTNETNKTYGPLSFNIRELHARGEVEVEITRGETQVAKFTVDNSETATNILDGYTLTAGDKITIYAKPNEGNCLVHFGYDYGDGIDVLNDETRDQAMVDAVAREGYTIVILGESVPTKLNICMDFQNEGGSGGSDTNITYGPLSFNIRELHSRGEVEVEITRDGTQVAKFTVDNSETATNILDGYALKAGDKITIYAKPNEGNCLVHFGYDYGDGIDVLNDETRDQAMVDAVAREGYTIVIPGESVPTKLNICMDFQNEGGSDTNITYGPLSFNIRELHSRGEVEVEITRDGTQVAKFTVDNPETATNILDGYTLTAGDKITIYAKPNEGNCLVHFGYDYGDGIDVLNDETRDQAMVDAVAREGYTIVIPGESVPTKLNICMDFQNEGGSDTNITYGPLSFNIRELHSRGEVEVEITRDGTQVAKFTVDNPETATNILDGYTLKAGDKITIYAKPNEGNRLAHFGYNYDNGGDELNNDTRGGAMDAAVTPEGYTIVIPSESTVTNLTINMEFQNEGGSGDQPGEEVDTDYGALEFVIDDLNVRGEVKVEITRNEAVIKEFYVGKDASSNNVLDDYTLTAGDKITLYAIPIDVDNELGNFEYYLGKKDETDEIIYGDNILSETTENAAIAQAVKLSGYTIELVEADIDKIRICMSFQHKEDSSSDPDEGFDPAEGLDINTYVDPNNTKITDASMTINWNDEVPRYSGELKLTVSDYTLTDEDRNNYSKAVAGGNLVLRNIRNEEQTTLVGLQRNHAEAEITITVEGLDANRKYIVGCEYNEINGEGEAVKNYVSSAAETIEEDGKVKLKFTTSKFGKLIIEEIPVLRGNQDRDVELRFWEYDAESESYVRSYKLGYIYLNNGPGNETGDTPKTTPGDMPGQYLMANEGIIVNGGYDHNSGKTFNMLYFQQDIESGIESAYLLNTPTFEDGVLKNPNMDTATTIEMKQNVTAYIQENETRYENSIYGIELPVTQSNVAVECYDILLNTMVRHTIVWENHVSNHFGPDARIDNGAAQLISIVDNDNKDLIASGAASCSYDENNGYCMVPVGAIVTIKLIPDYGYQVLSASIGGANLVPDDNNVSTFSFEMPDTNVHFAGVMKQTENKIEGTSTKVNTSATTIDNGANAAANGGTLKLTVEDNTSYVDTKKQEVADKVKEENANITVEPVATLDLTLDNIVNKASLDEYWKKNVTSFTNDINVNLDIGDIELAEGEELEVVREHENDLEVIEATYNDGILTVPTNRFSTYSIVKTSPYVSVTDVNVSASSKKFTTLNETDTINFEVLPENANNKSVTWSSADPSIATVDENGLITAVSNGVTMITAKSNDNNNISASVKVEVVADVETEEVARENIEDGTNPGSVSVETQIPANVKSSITISDFDTSTAKEALDESELLEVSDEGADAKISLYVTPLASVPLTEVDKVNTAKATLPVEEVTEIIKLDMSMFKQVGDDAERLTEIDNPIKIEIAISGDAILNDTTKTRHYFMIDVHNGDANVTELNLNPNTGKLVVERDKFSTLVIGYYDTTNVTNVTIIGDTVTLTEVDAKVQLAARIEPEGATVQDVTWSSSNPAVATVDANGKVTAVANGTTIIKATSNDNEAVYGVKEITVSIPSPCTHTETVVKDAKAATCIADGYTGDTYCKLCGVKISSGTVIKAAGHKYDAGKITKEPTVDAEGVKTYTCTVCGATKTEAIAKLTKPETPAVNVSYHTHIQNIGDAQGVKSNGQMAGTSGQSKRLENIWIKVDGNSNLGIQYSTHCQNYGWMPWSANGEANGTSGESKRLEAIKIQLTGADADKYDVYYRVHAQNYGWLAWVSNGAPSGTAGCSLRLEGIQVVVVKKGEAAPGLDYADVKASVGTHNSQGYINKSSSEIVIPGSETTPNVMYRTHIQNVGWQNWKYNGDMSGTSGRSLRLEGINIKLSNCAYSGGIRYTTHIQNYGWSQGWKSDGEMSGTSGESKRLEAIKIELTGELANHYDVYYRVHAQDYGWLAWAKNGEAAGTEGLSKRLEGIQVVIVPKGEAAPSIIYGNIISIMPQAFIKK